MRCCHLDIDAAERFPVFNLGFRRCYCAIFHHRERFAAQLSPSAQATSTFVGISAFILFLHFHLVADGRFARRLVLLPRSTLVHV